MKKAICFLSVCFLIQMGSAVHAEMSDRDYRKVVKSIVRDVEDLRKDYKHFSAVLSDADLDTRKDPFEYTFSYQNGVRLADNPGEGDEKIKIFSERDGIAMDLYFYTGEWFGEGAVRPFTLENLKIVAFVEGADTDEVMEIRSRVGQIILEHIQEAKK